MAIGLLGLILAAAFTGAAAYINLVEQPARLRLAPGDLLIQWKPSYKRGFTMQATLAAVSGGFGVAAWFQQSEVWFLVGGLALLLNWPYTLVVILPLNTKLMALAPADATSSTQSQVITWGWLHAGRTCLGLAGTQSYLAALLALGTSG